MPYAPRSAHLGHGSVKLAELGVFLRALEFTPPATGLQSEYLLGRVGAELGV